MPVFNKKDKSRYVTFTRRTLGVGGAMTAVLVVLAGRLYQLQILDGAQYKAASENNRINQRLLAPPRGRIIDRFGVELADNRRNYRVLLVAEQAVEGVEAAVDTLGKIIALSDEQKKHILRDIAQNKKFVPVPIAQNLTWEEFSRINLHLPYLPGVQPEVGETRSYPFANELAHVLGYVAAVSPGDKKNDSDPLLDLPGFRIGKRGIEAAYDKEVRGKAGVSRVEVNAFGRVIRELSRKPGVPGDDVYLTLDQQLQQFAVQRLADEAAACVVMDIKNGDVLALASTPSYDPNLFNVGITNAQWRALTNDDHKPLINKAVAGEYPPGSTFKPGMALAAMDNGLADLTVNCTGSMALGNHVFHCWAWKKGGHGHVDLKRGIQVSCDIFFYEVARRLGIDKMGQTARALGFGSVTGIEIPGERPGFFPTRAWKKRRFGAPWQQGETLVNGIGQGYVLATPLQLCTVAARLASGNAILPRIVRVVGGERQPRPQAGPLPFSNEAFAAVQAGMNMVTNVPGGTAYPWSIKVAGFEMAGKTGTAQVRRITKEERAHGMIPISRQPWRLREHALFIAFAPVGNPRYACATVLEHGAQIIDHQVQITRDVLLFAQQREIALRQTAYPVNAASLAPGRSRA
jgi:penicillin-binding protein 2